MTGKGNSRQAWLLALTAIATAIVDVTATAVDHERMLCANDNTPICGRSQGTYLLFKNECDLRNAQRENLMGVPIFDVALHYCLPDCDFECDAASQPVCGVSVASGERRSFRNRCEMMRAACRSKSDWLVQMWGPCPRGQRQPKQPAHTVLVGQRRRRRPIPCTNVYRPVCASYAGVKSTFSNECLVNAENIRTRRNWRIISEGMCGEDSTKMKHNRKWKPMAKANAKPKSESQMMERSKRSHQLQQQQQLNQLDEDFELSEDAVQIFAPSTFHTQFISNTGTMEKSYSLPARQPQAQPQAQPRRLYGSTAKIRNGQKQGQSSKPCVFSNEPVCGSFNGESRTFAHVCALMEHSQAAGNAWTILYEGRCRRCDKPCPSAYSPICANRNGISYTIINECYLERVRCKDPNSDWKITHKGECAPPAEEVAHGLPPPSPKPMAYRIPHMLYAASSASSSSSSSSSTTTTTPRSSALTRTSTSTPGPRRLLRKPKRPTPTPKDLSNRKIRKIELHNFEGFDAQPIKAPATSKLWSSKNSWQATDNVKDALTKRVHHKKAHSWPYNWPLPLATPLSLRTTTTPAPLNTLPGISEAQLLNFDLKSAADIFGEIEADTEILFMMDSTAATARAAATEATTSASTASTSTAVPTTASPATTTTAKSTTTATTRTTTTVAAISSEDTTENTAQKETEASVIDISTSSKSLDETTSEFLDPSTAATSTAAATTPATATTTTTTTTNSDSSSGKSSTPNLDYMSDEPQSTQSGHTSIYGLDKNSLIMKLLRARSGKNMVL
ncbi:uncharacterized protein [Drosophila virilis]|uniref:uncharacterized protein n=1 Tax=Drosophila virilis TaxID=7244 RepID=UPI00017D5C69|nr:mucin-2 [Drosophila virilis]